MKKHLIIVLTMLMVLGNVTMVFADADFANQKMSDVKGTKYETAVANLITKGIISGFEDGTYRPEATITRAEACVAVTKVLKPTETQLKEAADSGFNDLKGGYTWAKASINYAAAKDIVTGYGNGRFKPSQTVSYSELVAMLINAMGYKSSELEGSWPNNYLNKATELGILNAVITDNTNLDFNEAATRGNAALIVNLAVDRIVKDEEIKDSTITDKKDKDSDSADQENRVESSGKLANYSGRAYGMILDTAKVVNKDGESVYQLEFLIGDDICYLNTDTKCNIPNPIDYDGVLYTLNVVNGVVKDIATDGKVLKAKHFEELTSGWSKVTNRNGSLISVSNGGSEEDFTAIKDASFYLATFSGGQIDGYESASLSDITKDSVIRAYDVIDDSCDLANVIIIVESKQASKIGY
ncbi:S-layer homology domain-containing protein [Anaerovorax sp. IOR16]|uniref:S-layer homology domain-containing protein n=1 Tax=Anaerovorax sp. IOR16 TaxID=2773458 RepID=UPI0019CFD72A|nr:S-layer homology domain-containing protein [Anaerovorax sp. IOR16]